MKKLNAAIIIAIASLAINSCGSTKSAIADVPKPKVLPVDKEWTLEASPNGADVVGLIFALDSTGVPVRSLGGALAVKTSTSAIAITQQTKTKNVSVGAVANFLAIKNIDSTASLSFEDSSRLNATFIINSGTITVINDDISKAFNEKIPMIASNIKFLHLENAKFFLIMETIQSPNVNITFDKSSQKSANLAAKILSKIGIGGHVSKSSTDNTDLAYNMTEPVTVFYKLRSVDVNIIGSRGTEEEKVDVKLGRTVMADEIFKK